MVRCGVDLYGLEVPNDRSKEEGAHYVTDASDRPKSLRMMFEAPFYRWVYGESDGLPGLIVDRYEDCLAIQTLWLGMDRLQETVCDALEEVLKPRCIVERNESALREREGLPQRAGALRGTAPDTVGVREGDLLFDVRLLGGHKTGFYFDQRANRLAMRSRRGLLPESS